MGGLGGFRHSPEKEAPFLACLDCPILKHAMHTQPDILRIKIAKCLHLQEKY